VCVLGERVESAQLVSWPSLVRYHSWTVTPLTVEPRRPTAPQTTSTCTKSSSGRSTASSPGGSTHARTHARPHTHTHTGRYSLGECTDTPPALRNWVHEKMPGCAVELNRPTQNYAWFGSQISLITAMSFREAIPRTTHQGLCPLTPLGDFRSPDPLYPHLHILTAPLAEWLARLTAV